MIQFNLLGISGSLRQGSFNRHLIREAGRLMEGAKLTEADIDLPLYNGDVEDTHGIPAKVQVLADQIAAADAVVISTPEYNQSFSGVLKNALDWVSRTEGAPWKGKPVALISAAAGRAGGARAQYALRLAMTPFRPRLLMGPEVMVAAAQDQFTNGKLAEDEIYERSLKVLMKLLKAEAALVA
ncbi:NADPH-dependent FMN reductase [Profundibacter sp.]|uniref:NADPH-dependent FMN reductase n=1 Tax=Profundibacter sp. TaxID=3101071 RepID=UPI003D0AC056